MENFHLESERLRLRPFTMDDVDEIVRLAGDKEIARTTANIPHPYTAADAQNWIKSHKEAFQKGRQVTLAITRREDGALMGAVGLLVNEKDNRGSLGYWVGQAFWKQGIATEAAGLLLEYGFVVRELNRIYAEHLVNNPASGRVMQKLGMQKEGVLRQHHEKWGEYIDSVMYGILRNEYLAGLNE